MGTLEKWNIVNRIEDNISTVVSYLKIVFDL